MNPNPFETDPLTSAALNAETLLAQARHFRMDDVSPVTASIHPSATYHRKITDSGYATGPVYSRPHHPTYQEVESMISALEGGQSTLLFASGMAAITTVLLSYPLGTCFIAPNTCYIGLRNWFHTWAAHYGYQVFFYKNDDPDDLVRISEKASQHPAPHHVLWVETPSNPLMEITDLTRAGALAKHHRFDYVVDNTVPTPLLTRPLTFGADFVVHSCSKALNGHHDVVAGSITTKTTDHPQFQKMMDLRNAHGSVLGAFEAWLLMRGMKTLTLRVQKSCENTLALALHLQNHPQIERVLYPGLPDHPNHDTARAQMFYTHRLDNHTPATPAHAPAYGALMSICVRGDAKTALHFIKHLKVFQVATSLGGTESLIEHRATVEDYKLTTPENLLRISVGIENVHDLKQDIDQALRLL